MDILITFPLFTDNFALNLPRYFTIFGFNIYYYALFITAGYMLAGAYLLKRKKLFGLTSDNLLDLVLIALICGILGARLYFMLFNFERYFGPGQWMNIIRLRDGGLAVYGGIIASGLGFWIYSRFKKIPVGSLLDVAAFGLFIGQAVGRWGNFFNREAFGIETDLPWRMGLTTGGFTTYVHPAFLYESLWNIIGFLAIHIFSKVSKTKYPGQYFLFYVAWYGLGRFMIEGIRIDSLLLWGTDIRVSQLVAAVSCLTALLILFINFLRGKSDDRLKTHPKDDDDSDSDEEDEIDGDKATDEESVDDLAELDGVSKDDVESESEDGADNEEESKTEDDSKEDSNEDSNDSTSENKDNEDSDDNSDENNDKDESDSDDNASVEKDEPDSDDSASDEKDEPDSDDSASDNKDEPDSDKEDKKESKKEKIVKVKNSSGTKEKDDVKDNAKDKVKVKINRTRKINKEEN